MAQEGVACPSTRGDSGDGKSGLKGLMIGSVTQKAIGSAPCPVLVVPA